MELKLARAELDAKPKTISLEKIEAAVEMCIRDRK